jgi:hypothetical protein
VKIFQILDLVIEGYKRRLPNENKGKSERENAKMACEVHVMGWPFNLMMSTDGIEVLVYKWQFNALFWRECQFMVAYWQ